MKFHAAIVQMDTTNDWKKNKYIIENYVKEAVKQGADYIQFPETVEYIGKNLHGFAEEKSVEVKKFFADLAGTYGIYLNCGSITEAQNGKKPRNTALFFASDGRLLDKYSKLHLFDVDVTEGPSYKESAGIEAGSKIAAVDTELGTFGLSICYDLRFPELYRSLALEGAQLLCVSANFTKPTGIDHWKPLLLARAIENTCFVLAAGQCGQKPKFEAYGHSMVIDPWGRILMEMSEEPEMEIVEIDTARIEEVRKQLPCLANRRTDIWR